MNSVAFSPDGSLLASGSARQHVRLWDVASRQAKATLRVIPVGVSAWPSARMERCSPPANDDKTVRLWNVTRRRPLGGALEGHGAIVADVAFSPNGKILASAGYDKTVRLWDVTSRQPLGEPLEGHRAIVASVAFSPNGKILASASYDGTVQLWDVVSRRPLGQSLNGHKGIVARVAFSRPDGRTLASASMDGTIRLWDVSADAWSDRACRLANRNLSQDEWQQYVGQTLPLHCTCSNLPCEDVAAK